MLPNENVSRVLKALYPLGFLLAVVPMVDWFAKVYPFFPGMVQWRFGALVALVPQLAIILTGFGLTVAIAAFVGHSGFLRVLAGIGAVGSLLALVVLVMFVLDTMQMRASIADENTRAGMLKALVSGTLTALMAVIVSVSVAFGAWRGAADVARRGRAKRADGALVRGGRPAARAGEPVLTEAPTGAARGG